MGPSEPPADLDLAGRAPLPRPWLGAREADDLVRLVEHGPEAESVLGVVPALAGGELLVDRQLGRRTAVELHDVRVVEDPVPGEGVLVGGDAQPYHGEGSVHGAALQQGDQYR